MSPKDAHMIAEYINSIKDPDMRRRMHSFQCDINKALDAVPEEERLPLVMSMWRDKADELFIEFNKLYDILEDIEEFKV